MSGRDNSNQLPILTAASFSLRYFLGPAKALLVAAWGPRMDLRHCFPARELSAGSCFLLLSAENQKHLYLFLVPVTGSRSPHGGTDRGISLLQ